MSNLDIKRVAVDLEITANKVKGVSAALSYLRESAVDRGDDIAPLLLLLSNSAFDAANELEAMIKNVESGDEAEQDKAALAEADYDEIRAMIRRRKQASGEAPPIEFELTADQFSDLVIVAKQAGLSVDDFASRLVSDHLKRWLDEPATA